MTKKLAGIGVLCLLSAFAYAQTLASDSGSKTIINHSNGVLIYPVERLEVLRSTSGLRSKVIRYYTTTHAFPATFAPNSIVFDAGCQKYTLTNEVSLGGSDTADKPIFCAITPPFQALDAGVFTVFRDTDGGYGVSQCPAIAALPTNAWSAFCQIQAGRIQ